MTRPHRAIPALIALCLAIAACGGGGSTVASSEDTAQLPSENDVAQVGRHVITRSLLNTWMTVDLATDYYEATKRQVPAGLVSEPANYPACARALEGVAAKSKTQPLPSAASLKSKCEVLYQAIKQQTLTFLVGSYWNINFDTSHGVNVSDAEVARKLAAVRAKEYPKPGQFEESLRLRRRDMAEEQFIAKIDLLQAALKSRLSNKAEPELEAQLGSANDDAICRAEYVVKHCKESGAVYTGPSPATLAQEIAH